MKARDLGRDLLMLKSCHDLLLLFRVCVIVIRLRFGLWGSDLQFWEAVETSSSVLLQEKILDDCCCCAQVESRTLFKEEAHSAFGFLFSDFRPS